MGCERANDGHAGTIDQAAVERAYRTLVASISDFDFHGFISARTSGDDEWLDAA